MIAALSAAAALAAGALVHALAEAGLGRAFLGAWRRWAERRLIRRSARQWPQALLFLAGAVGSGASVDEALDLLSRQAPEPLRSRLSLSDAAPSLSPQARVQRLLADPALAFARAALLLFIGSGGRVGRLLHTAAGVLQQRSEAEERVRALTAQARASSWIVALTPLGLAGAMALLAPEFLEPLVRTRLGRWILGGAVLLSFGGLALSLRLSRVEM